MQDVFFNNPGLAAKTTAVDEGLITRYTILLKAMISGFKIAIDKFKIFAFDKGKVLVEK